MMKSKCVLLPFSKIIAFVLLVFIFKPQSWQYVSRSEVAIVMSQAMLQKAPGHLQIILEIISGH